MAGGRFYRVEAESPDAEGRRAGIFALLRDLRRSGRLSDADTSSAERLVARSYGLHDEPPAGAYPPGALSWFVADAGEGGVALRTLVGDIERMLSRHGVTTRTVWADDPGRVTYADAVQVVAVPADLGPRAAEHRRPVGFRWGEHATRGHPVSGATTWRRTGVTLFVSGGISLTLVPVLGLVGAPGWLVGSVLPVALVLVTFGAASFGRSRRARVFEIAGRDAKS